MTVGAPISATAYAVSYARAVATPATAPQTVYNVVVDPTAGSISMSLLMPQGTSYVRVTFMNGADNPSYNFIVVGTNACVPGFAVQPTGQILPIGYTNLDLFGGLAQSNTFDVVFAYYK